MIEAGVTPCAVLITLVNVPTTELLYCVKQLNEDSEQAPALKRGSTHYAR